MSKSTISLLQLFQMFPDADTARAGPIPANEPAIPLKDEPARAPNYINTDRQGLELALRAKSPMRGKVASAGLANLGLFQQELGL